MKKAKVLMVHNYYKTGGGEHTVFENEKKLLRDNGHEVIEYTRDNNDIKGIKGKILTPLVTIFNFKTFFQIRRILKNEAVDLVHCHNTFPLISPSVYYAAKSMHVPTIQTIHNFRFICPNGLLYNKGVICEKCLESGLKNSVKNKCYRNSTLGSIVVASMLKIHRALKTYERLVDKYIVLSEFNKNKLSTVIPENKMKVKPNFSNVFLKDNIKACNKEYFLFVGRLDEAKGIRFLLEAWTELKYEKLLVVGDGPLSEEVENAARINNNIDFLGSKSHEEVLSIISRAKALIFTSECYEGFPMVLLEAMSQETTILTTDIGNANSIIGDEIGLKYKHKNVEDFIFNINKLSKKEVCSSLGKKSREYFELNYSIKANYNKINEIYNEVIRNGRN